MKPVLHLFHGFFSGLGVLLLFCIPWCFSEGFTYHYPYLRDTLCLLLTPCLFLTLYLKQSFQFHRGEFQFTPNKLLYFGLAFWLWILFTFSSTASALFVETFLKATCILFLFWSFSHLADPLRIRTFLYGSFVAALLFIVSHLLNKIGVRGSAHGFERPFYNPNAVALFLTFPCFLSFAFVKTFKGKMIFLCFLFALLLSRSEGAGVGLACGFILWRLLSKYPVFFVEKKGILLCLFVGLISSFWLLPYLYSFFPSSSSVQIRANLIEGAESLWKNPTPFLSPLPAPRPAPFSWWMGHGLGSFRLFYGNHRPLAYHLWDEATPYTLSPHHFQWELLCETGIIGLLLFYGILGMFFSYSLSLLSSKKLSLEEEQEVKALVAGMCALVVQGLFSHFFFTLWNGLVLALIAGRIFFLYVQHLPLPSPYPAYLLAPPSEKQKHLDFFLFWPLLAFSLIFIHSFVWKPLLAEYRLKQARYQKESPLEEKISILENLLAQLPYETDARRVARTYLISYYTHRPPLQEIPYLFFQKAFEQAQVHFHLYQKNGLSLRDLAQLAALLEQSPKHPFSRSPYKTYYLSLYAQTFPADLSIADFLETYSFRMTPSERQELRTLEKKLTQVLGEWTHGRDSPKPLQEPYSEFERFLDSFNFTLSQLYKRFKGKGVNSSQTHANRKIAALSYILYQLASLRPDGLPEAEFWIECATIWEDSEHFFYLLEKAYFFFQHGEVEKAELLFPQRKITRRIQDFSQIKKEIQDFLKQKKNLSTAFQEFLKKKLEDYP